MSNSVADIRANKNENINHAAEIIGKSAHRLAVFVAIYRGKRKQKSVSDICNETGLSQVRVLQEAAKLAANEIVEKTRPKGRETIYEKIEFFTHHKKSILSLIKNPKKAEKFPTKQRPKISSTNIVNIRIPAKQVKIEQITIDDISSFQKCKKQQATSALAKISESRFKQGILKIIGEKGAVPKDWGGEKNDIYTTRLKIGGKRFHAAFALKGPGQKAKKLTPRHMGKNGDQIQRLLTGSSVQVFMVQYWGEIDQSVVDQMREFAIARSYSEGRKLYFGIIDGADSSRLMKAYPRAFK